MSEIWIVMLRPCDDNGTIAATGVMSLREMLENARWLDLRMHFNSIRLLTMRLPAGTRRDQVFDAFELLTNDERVRLYNLPQHPMRLSSNEH